MFRTGRPYGACSRIGGRSGFRPHAYGGTLENLPDGIQVRPSDGLNIRFFNPTDRCELIGGGSRGQPNEFQNLHT